MSKKKIISCFILSLITISIISSWDYDTYPIQTPYGTFYFNEKASSNGAYFDNKGHGIYKDFMKVTKMNTELRNLGFEEINSRIEVWLDNEKARFKDIMSTYKNVVSRFYMDHTISYVFSDDIYLYIYVFGGTSYIINGDYVFCYRTPL
jgi:hypothetical protein